MKIIYNKIIPFGRRFYAINLFGVLFAKGPCNAIIINHERIHTFQIRELLYVFFYLFYVIEWMFRLFQYRNFFEAYKNISFEREAYFHQFDPNYLSKRKIFSFMTYLKKDNK